MGNNYKFQVQALNAAGTGPLSPESLSIVAATPPDHPTDILRVYADDEVITIGWKAPAYNGGSPVTGYKVYWDYASNGLGWEMIEDDVLDSLVYTRRNDVIVGRIY